MMAYDEDQPQVDFVLPGRWWRIRLDSDAEVRRSARALADEVVGPADDMAQLRARIREDIERAALLAKGVNGHEFYFLLELQAGFGPRMTLTVAWPEVPAGPSRVAGTLPAAAGLAASLKESLPELDVDVLDVNKQCGVVRVTESPAEKAESPAEAVAEGAEPVADGTESGSIPQLSAGYWFVTPGSLRTLLMRFSSPLIEQRDELLYLWDAIASSVAWRTEPELSGSAPGA